MQPVISEERLLQIAQYIDIGFSIVLWLTYFLAIMASFQHVAWAFSLLEAGNQTWVGYLAAAAVDGALAVMAYLIQQRRKEKQVARKLGESETAVEGTQALWFGLVFLGGISVIANFLHGAHVELNTETLTWANLMQLDGLQWLRLATNAIALPLIVVFLGEVVTVPGANGLISDLVRRNKILQESAHLLDTVRTDLAHVRTELSEAVANLTTTRTKLTTAQENLNTTRTELATTAAALNKAQTDLHLKETELTKVQAELAKLKQQMDILSIPAQETIQYLISQAAGGDDTQEAAAGRASERLGKPVSRSLIGRTARILRMDEA
jgi:hypothetical protein